MTSNKRFSFPLHYQILIAIIAGGLFGYFFHGAVKYTNWIGDIFLRALNMIIVPLILCSITNGVASVGSGENLGRLGFKTIGFYILSTLIAIITGFVLVTAIKPGTGAELGLTMNVENIAAASDNFGQTLIRIIPSNIFEALAQGQMLGIILFSILFGYFITKLNEDRRTLLTGIISAALDVIMKLTLFIIKFTPLGIFSITAKVIAQQISIGNDISEVISRLGLYFLTVLAGLLIHGFITLPLMVKVLGKANPFKHLKNMMTPLLTAFTTSSSNATLPLTLEAVQNKDGVSGKIASFTLPLGATINMNGTALYECVAVMFIAQAYGVDLSLTQQLIVIFTALLAAIGAAGIPMAGLVMMAVVLKAVGLPLEGIGLVLAVDRILDMFRTALNVYGDTCAAVIIAKSEGEKLSI
ncbi:MAG TPA: dicarboxylate/amino acid:cation symporter [Bacteroidales bacterium]|nr:dicarboxylate/amino acid:cation symporter [Bacteroidales bacterium]HOK74666.1 dicarboxylate/amino acid:cation symporter [Bacteroidales bacterium]HOM39663.1 dicarboxylate/amino acid:cation symporter [Bacteroidales bacterium]HPP92055.1 dicarboxylate/amino acid:cation symporter [Bacteroidales bacterium]HQG55859.1 dicarboxylate/amino acid:cation symporter [Bacteroidales bacterium]